ncbi:MAG: chromosomal replication initiator protein DnaA [Veillonella sp.]|nr:chromosomal replication initiator protein DnaA [Veillonella sp.]
MSIDNNSIHIGVMQSFIKSVIESQQTVSKLLTDAIQQVTGKQLNMVLLDLFPLKEEAPAAPQVADTFTGNTAESTTTNTIENASVSDTENTIATTKKTAKQEVPYQEEFYTPVYADPVYIKRQEVHELIPDEPMFPIEQPQTAQTLQSTDIPIDLSSSQLNSGYRFDNYITGNANRIPFGAAQNVSEHPGGDYNPLFIYGPSGLGKTHLMHAIGNAIVERYPNLKVMCTTSEKFMNLFIESIRKRQGELFRNTFRNIDVLLIDDIQFLENKEGTKTEFFNTFNELLDNNKQIVLTSDTMPNDMDQFEERLRSRFQAGYVATMENPDAILKALVEKENNKNRNLVIDNDAINYVALQFDENIRVLQGAFNKLIGTASLEQRTSSIDLEYTKKTLSDIITTERVTLIDIESIQDFISTYFNIKKQDLLGKKRKAQFAFPRQIAMYLCRDVINESYPQIAAAFSRDHTTILHAYDKISKEIDKNPETKQIILDIKSKLSSLN